MKTFQRWFLSLPRSAYVAILMRTIPDKNVQVWASEPHSNGSRWRFDWIFLRSFIPVQCFCRPFRSTPLEKSSAPPFCFVFLGVFFFFFCDLEKLRILQILWLWFVFPPWVLDQLPSWRHYATLQKPGWIEAICRPGRCGGWTSWSACPGPCSTFLQQKTNDNTRKL